jgi:hypothetical protein
MGSTEMPDDNSTEDTTREASAVFGEAKALQSAVDDLLEAGLPRAALSVLGSDEAIRAKFGGELPDARDLAENPETPRGNFVSSDSRAEGIAALAGIPVYVGGAGAAAIAALEGATIVATAGAAVGVGLAAGALGLYVARRMEKRHAHDIDEHLKHGGLVLWVRVDDKEQEAKALKALRDNGAKNISVHTVKLPEGPEEVPFHDVQPDPFVEKG